MQLATDHLVHGWDLAVATGGDTRIDPHLVHAVAAWFDDREEIYRGGGAIAARRQLVRRRPARPAGPLRPGRGVGAHHQTLVRFNNAFGSGDVDAALALVTDDIVFDATSPFPDGERLEGRDAVRTAWTEVMGTPGMTFTEEESFVSGDRAVVRWRYAWGGPDAGTSGASTSCASATDWSARSSPTSRADRSGPARCARDVPQSG